MQGSPAHSARRTLAAAAFAAILAAALSAAPDGRYPKRFAAVQEGVLYRCGEVSPAQLEYLRSTYGLRAVLSLLDPTVPESVAERAAARRLGLTWHNVPLRGNGESTPAARDAIRRILLDPGERPLLVHCAAGVNRTGLVIGMYRMHVQGWSLDEVLSEMRRFDFQDLPKHANLRAALADEAQRAGQARRAAAGGTGDGADRR